MTPLLSSLREPPIVGQFYMVPVIIGYPYNGRIDDWPVIGPKHTDSDFINFHDEHYHVDARFLTAAQERHATSGSKVYGSPASLEQIVGARPLASRGAVLPKGRPALVRRKCRRADYGHVYRERKEIVALRAHYGEPAQAVTLADGRKLCPHRKADLTQFPADADGMVVCPLHGLKVCVSRNLLTQEAVCA